VLQTRRLSLLNVERVVKGGPEKVSALPMLCSIKGDPVTPQLKKTGVNKREVIRAGTCQCWSGFTLLRPDCQVKRKSQSAIRINLSSGRLVFLTGST
jgi:hypothetical protein